MARACPWLTHSSPIISNKEELVQTQVCPSSRKHFPHSLQNRAGESRRMGGSLTLKSSQKVYPGPSYCIPAPQALGQPVEGGGLSNLSPYSGMTQSTMVPTEGTQTPRRQAGPRRQSKTGSGQREPCIPVVGAPLMRWEKSS